MGRMPMWVEAEFFFFLKMWSLSNLKGYRLANFRILFIYLFQYKDLARSLAFIRLIYMFTQILQKCVTDSLYFQDRKRLPL